MNMECLLLPIPFIFMGKCLLYFGSGHSESKCCVCMGKIAQDVLLCENERNVIIQG